MKTLAELRAERAARTPEERKALEEAWLKENAEALAAHNKRIDEHGMLFKPIWEDEDYKEISSSYLRHDGN